MSRAYSETIGYSPLHLVDQGKMLDLVRIIKSLLADHLPRGNEAWVLVAGAGSGLEALLIQREFQLRTAGVDLNIDPGSIPAGSPHLHLQRGDLTALAFRDRGFDLAYSYHVLEHVADHVTALGEIHRVLKPGGAAFIGFPNKNRLISYIGTSQRASLGEKIRWNLNDYRCRLQGKFENRLGAHAGFTEKEFIRDASQIFSSVEPVRDQYMLRKYPGLGLFLKGVIQLRLAEFVFPSNYFICQKGKAGDEQSQPF